MPTVRDIVRKTTDFFTEKGIGSARLDSELLIASALGWERLQVFLKFDYPLTEDELEKCRELVRRRTKGEPVAYILGEKGFYNHSFKVGPAVLIPRPETEMLVDAAIAHEGRRILDLGCGSGCIGLSILREWVDGGRENVSLDLVDLSEEAMTITHENAERLGVIDRCAFHVGDAGEVQLEPAAFDVVVANPPYIDPTDPKVEPAVKAFEPSSALFAGGPGDGGLLEISRWAKTAMEHVAPAGLVLFEIGDGQGANAISTFKEVGFSNVKLARDLSDRERMIVARPQ